MSTNGRLRLAAAGAALAAATIAASGCGKKEETSLKAPPFEEVLQQKLLDAKPGDVIVIPEGKFAFDRSLSLRADGVTLRGAGMDKSILSFKGQAQGAEGLLVTASDFTIEDLAIEDSKGDGLKVTDGSNIVIRRVRVEWTGGPKTQNGAYGIYPVQTKNVLMEGNVAIGASDAGIYVGQSENVVVRGNRAERNVAGIEIENTTGADVYDNVATDNTGGLLVFNMPNLQHAGSKTRVFRNKIVDNDRGNFGVKGTAVAAIPAGSGVVIQSNDEVEIFDNDITGHRTANVIIASVFTSGLSLDGMREDFDPFPEGIYVYGNRLGGGGTNPDGPQLTALKVATQGLTGALPDILWDGFVNQAKMQGGVLPAASRICVDQPGVDVMNFDGPNKSKNPRIDNAPHACTLPKLAPVALTGPLAALTTAPAKP
ncbi:MAG: right-handed parallel beta-helix repeat-containing protein [Parvularculaceae bacterium]|nr:right-handed parallel beta-helix repeat-containing protein [Parvularculaceae bacterium]